MIAKKFLLTLGLGLVLALSACAGVPSAAPTLTVNCCLGQTPPGLEPQVFAPGLVSSSGMREYNGVFSPGMDEYYFYHFSDTVRPVLLVTRLLDGTWTEPAPLPELAGMDASEPFITMDGQRLYFLWGAAPGRSPTDPPVYYFIERTPQGWSEPVYAGQGMFLSGDRQGHLYTTDMSTFTTNRHTHLASLTLTDGVFTAYEPVPVDPPWGHPAHPCIAPDGSYLVFDVGSGNYLFVTFLLPDGTWSQPIDLTQHGFNARAGGAYVSPDGRYLFFSLDGDIWWVDSQVIENLRPQ